MTVVDLVHHTVKKDAQFWNAHGPARNGVQPRRKTALDDGGNATDAARNRHCYGKILRSWETHQERSHLIVVTPDEKKIYITNTISGTLTVLNRETGNQKVIVRARVRRASQVARWPRGMGGGTTATA